MTRQCLDATTRSSCVAGCARPTLCRLPAVCSWGPDHVLVTGNAVFRRVYGLIVEVLG